MQFMKSIGAAAPSSLAFGAAFLAFALSTPFVAAFQSHATSSSAGTAGSDHWVSGEVEGGATGQTPAGTPVAHTNTAGKVKWKYCAGKEEEPGKHGPHEEITFSGEAAGSVGGGIAGGGTTVNVSGGSKVEVGKPAAGGASGGDAAAGTVTNILGNGSFVTVNGSAQTIQFKAGSPKPHDNEITANGSGTVKENDCPDDNKITTLGGPWKIQQ